MINYACLSFNKKRGLGTLNLLGGGGSASVYRGTYLKNDVAIKILHFFQLDVDIINRFCTETLLLSSVRHPNVVHMEGVCIIPPCICIVLELCKMSLYDFLHIPSVL